VVTVLRENGYLKIALVGLAGRTETK